MLRLPCAGGGQLTRRPTVVSHGGDMVAVCNADRIRIYSALSGEILFTFEGHSDEVTTLCIHPLSEGKLYSGSKDGTIKLWDFRNGTCLSTWDMPDALPVESMTVVESVAYVSCHWRNEEAGRAFAFDLLEGVARETRVKLTTPRPMVSSWWGDASTLNAMVNKKGKDISKNRIDSDGRRVIATHDKHTILVWEAGSFGSKAPLALHHTKAFTCVAVSPDGSKIAAGDVTGRILIWHDIHGALNLLEQHEEERRHDMEMSDEKPWAFVEPPAATVHWHAHPVGCVTFSADGCYILSGGQEAVLVIWDVRSGSRAYLPRLGGALTGITPCPSDGAKYAIRQSDNVVRIVNVASMTIECSIYGVRPQPNILSYPSVLFESHSGNAVISGPNCVLQFYDIVRDLHIDRLQLSKRNIVSISDRSETFGMSLEPSLQTMVFSRDARTLVTLESHPDASESFNTLIYVLKFWDRSPDGSREYGAPYVLNTLAENPHKTSSPKNAVTGVAFNDALDLVGTSSETGDFALWERYASQSAGQSEPVKSWRRIACIPGHKGEALSAIAFSTDGTITAVSGCQHLSGGVSLWNTRTCTLLGVLPSGINSNTGFTNVSKEDRNVFKDSLFFVRDSPYCVLICQHGISLYSIVKMQLVWSVRLEGISTVAVDPESQHWAIVVENPQGNNSNSQSSILMFNGAENRPCAGWSVRKQRSSKERAVTSNPTHRDIPSFRSGEKNSNHARIDIAFIPVDTPAYSSSITCAPPGCSPLMVFTSDREFSLAISSTMKRQDIQKVHVQGPTKKLGFEQKTSGFQSLFGTNARHSDSITGVKLEGVYGKTDAWRTILDAPSHALPPMATLCPAFLELMIESSGRE